MTKKSRRMQYENLKNIAIIGAERASKPVFIKYTGMAFWQIALASSVGGLVAVTVLDLLTSKDDDSHLQEYLEITFPMDGFLSSIPLGLLGPTEFALGMKIANALPQPDPSGTNQQLLINHFVADPIIDLFNLDHSESVRYSNVNDVKSDLPWFRYGSDPLP
jgi:hypothetical protein